MTYGYYQQQATRAAGGIFTFFFICLLIALAINILVAYLMAKLAQRKGYGKENHIMAICFWLGIYGIIYTIFLPDLTLRAQNQEIIELLKVKDIEDL